MRTFSRARVLVRNRGPFCVYPTDDETPCEFYFFFFFSFDSMTAEWTAAAHTMNHENLDLLLLKGAILSGRNSCTICVCRHCADSGDVNSVWMV